MRAEPKSNSIKTKIMIGFGLVICGVLFVGFIAYKSFNLLVSSVDTIAQPDRNIILLNQIVRDLAEAEIKLKESTLDGSNKMSLQPFLDYTDSLRIKIDSLRILSEENQSRLATIDTIESLINEKFKGTGGFFLLYQKKKNTDYYGKVIDEISSKESIAEQDDSLLNDPDLGLTIDSAAQIIDSISKNSSPAEKKRFLDFRSRKRKYEDSVLLANEKAKNKERLDQVFDEVAKAAEKEFAANQPSGLATDTVTRIISDIKREEQQSDYAITAQEREIIENNSKIIQRVKLLIGEMEAEEAKIHSDNVREARNTASQAIMIIIATGILGTFSGIMFIYIIFNDITRRNFYRRQLDRARQQAVNEAKAKEEFLANMSHEIRTPLNAILGFSEQLSNTSLEATQENYLKAVRNSSTHLLSTVNDVLDFSKIQANKLSIEKIPFKLFNVIEEVHDTLKLKAAQKNIEFKYHIDDKLDQMLIGDPFRLKQILINLSNNALKFTEEGFVEIDASLEKGFKNKIICRIEVNDTGIGIAEENLDKIFEGFSQSDSSTTRKYGGTGLGLTISKRLVELQHGDLKVTSKEGEGSSFIITMTFDIAKDFKPIEKSESIQIDEGILKGLNILVADDDELNLQLNEIIFKKWAINGDYFINGRDALEAIKAKRYDLIITDIQMPEFSGMDLSIAVRELEDESKAGTPILAFTANVMKDDIQKYLNSGITDYLLKPFKEVHLYNKIVSLLKLTPGNKSVSKQNGSNKTNGVARTETTKQSLFNIEEILMFTGARNESLLEVLESFINSSTSSILMMDSGLKNRDWEKVSMMAHKMLPSYQHLKIDTVVPMLKTLERLNGNIKPNEIESLVQKVSKRSEEAIKAIKLEVIQLKKELSKKQVAN